MSSSSSHTFLLCTKPFENPTEKTWCHAEINRTSDFVELQGCFSGSTDRCPYTHITHAGTEPKIKQIPGKRKQEKIKIKKTSLLLLQVLAQLPCCMKELIITCKQDDIIK